MRDRHARHRRADSDPGRRPTDGFRASSAQRFGRLVRDAVGSLPRPLLAYLDGVHIAVDELPPVAPDDTEVIQLGTWVGAARRPVAGLRPSPDRIILYRRPLEARARSQRDLIDVIREALVHELADHHGLSDDELGSLGWN